MIEMSVEYTDAPATRPEPSVGDKMPCPYCGHPLPKDVPGLGHIYKGHKLAGFLWMFGAIPVGIFVLLAAFASAGWGLGLFFFYLFAVMLHAYAVDDRVVPPREDEGEEY